LVAAWVRRASLKCCDCFGLRPRNDKYVFASEAKQFLVMASEAKPSHARLLQPFGLRNDGLVFASEAKQPNARLLQPFGLRNDALK
jgi:predicted NAD/FAD-binding protein